MDIQDPSTWTEAFAASHRTECVRFLQETNELSIRYIRQQNYPAAIVGLNMIMNGLTVMQEAKCGDFRSHIAMFSMITGLLIVSRMEGPEDKLRNTAIAAFADAVDFARSDGTKRSAEELRTRLQSGEPLSRWREEYDEAECIGILQGLNGQMEKALQGGASFAASVRKPSNSSASASPVGNPSGGVSFAAPVHDATAPSYFDGKTLPHIGWSILAFLLTVITGGIAYPWAFCMLVRWETEHTVICGRRLKFNGHGHQLFGRHLLWGFLTLITCGIYGIWYGLGLKKWKIRHTVYTDNTGEFESRFTGKAGGWFIQHLIAGLITVFTLGIGKAWADKRLLRWEAEHTVIGGSPLVFEGTGGQLFVNYLLAGIFSMLTLGIYALYFPIKLLKWQYSNTKALCCTEKIRARSLEHEVAANKDFAKYRIAASDTELEMFKSGIDGTESEQRLEELASGGNPYAQYKLAVKLKGENDRFDGRALELLEASAGAKYYKALFDYTEQNKAQEERYSRYGELLEDAAKAGSSEAVWRLAEFYKAEAYAKDGGKSGESLKLFKQAAYWFKVAIEQEYPMALASKLDYAVLIDRIALLEARVISEQTARKTASKGAVIVASAVLVALVVCMATITAVSVNIVDRVDRSFSVTRHSLSCQTP